MLPKIFSAEISYRKKCNGHKNTWLLCLNLFQSIFKLNCCIKNFTGRIRFGFLSVNICDGFCFVLLLQI